jgi:hypothetical protein
MASQTFRPRLASNPLHAFERLLLSAIGILEFFNEQFADLGLHFLILLGFGFDTDKRQEACLYASGHVRC